MMRGGPIFAALALGALGALSLGLACAANPGGHAAAYYGHTSQRPGRDGVQQLPDNAVSFSVTGGHVRDVIIPWVAPCVDSFHGKPDAPLIDRSAFDPLALRNGRFSTHNGGYRSSPGPGQRANVLLVLDGVIHGRRASGTLSVTASVDVDNIYTSDFCGTSKPIRWRAALR